MGSIIGMCMAYATVMWLAWNVVDHWLDQWFGTVKRGAGL